MKKILTLIILSFCFLTISAVAQEARKIDEFGKIFCDDYLARIDGIIVSLKELPSSKVFVMVYEGKESFFSSSKSRLPQYGQANAYINSIKKRLSILYNINLDNFVFLKAGFRENLIIEFWSVPVGATPPTPTPTLKKMKYRKGKPRGFCITM